MIIFDFDVIEILSANVAKSVKNKINNVIKMIKSRTHLNAYFWRIVRVRQLSRHVESERVIPRDGTVPDLYHLSAT